MLTEKNQWQRIQSGDCAAQDTSNNELDLSQAKQTKPKSCWKKKEEQKRETPKNKVSAAIKQSPMEACNRAAPKCIPSSNDNNNSNNNDHNKPPQKKKQKTKRNPNNRNDTRDGVMGGRNVTRKTINDRWAAVGSVCVWRDGGCTSSSSSSSSSWLIYTTMSWR